ncbi:MAG: hypothetical protein M3Y53_12910 [Thermoproteota archaeon]|nr:hypothetical protein [Thermoproteota archaeon]
MNVHAFCDTKALQDAKAQRALQSDIGAVCTIGGLVCGPVGHFVKSARSDIPYSFMGTIYNTSMMYATLDDKTEKVGITLRIVLVNADRQSAR